MKFKELLEKHPLVELATEKNNQEILDFFDSFPMTGEDLQIRYERKPNFFEFLDFATKSHFVLTIRNKKNELSGVGTLTIRPGIVNGKIESIGYLGDLRVKSDRRTTIYWRDFYNDLITHSSSIEELQGCRYFLTAIIDSNIPAVNALVNSKKSKYCYIPIAPYEMVNITDRFSKKKTKFTCRYSNRSDFESIRFFLKSEHEKKFLGLSFCEEFDELNYRLNTWNDFNDESFLLTYEENKLVGVTGLWSPSPAKKIIVEKVPFSMKMMLAFKSLYSKVPKEGEEFSALYLTLLTINSELGSQDKSDVFRSMLNFLFDGGINKKWHAISFCDYKDFSLSGGYSGFVNFKTPMSLYLVTSKESPIDVPGKESLPPYFEMALV